MLVFIDSSILCTDFYMKGTKFELLRRSATIVLSEIVIDEVKNKYKELLSTSTKTINKAITELNKVLHSPLDLIPDNIEKELKNYDDFIDFFLIESGMTIAEPYPSVTHKTVVERALARKKPFKQNGQDGYRDFLVWQSFLEFAKTYAYNHVCFLTLNKKDFSDEKDDSLLHPDLISDLDNAKIDKSRIQYWSSFDNFIDKVIKPQLKEIQENKELSSSLLNDDDNFVLPLKSFLLKSLIGLDLNNCDVAVYGSDATIDQIDEICDIVIEEISQTTNGEYLLEIQVDVFCSIKSRIAKTDLALMKKREIEELVITNLNQSDSYVIAEESILIKVGLAAIYNVTKKKYISLEIDDVSDYNCPYCSDYYDEDDE